MPHDELGLDLLDRVHRHADHDEERRAAEVELDVQALGQEFRERRVQRRPDPGKLLDLEPADQHHRKDRHRREVDRPAEGEARQDLVDVLGRLLAGADAWDEAAVLLHVVGLSIGLKMIET